MRHRVRIQPYISPDLHRRLRAHAATRNLTDSALAEAALAEYFDRQHPDEGVVLGRLQGLSESVARLHYDVEALGQGFGVFARYVFRALTFDTSTDAGARAERLFTQFITVVSRELDAGLRLTGQIDRARGRTASQPPDKAGAERGGSR